MSTKKSKEAESETPAVEPGERTPASPLLDPFGLGDMLRWPARFPRPWPEFMRDDSIRVEEFMEDDDLHIRAEIPGVDPDKDIDITVDHGRLSIRAEREERTEKTEDGYHSEFRYGSFSRVLTLPEGADADDVRATYEDGILDVRVPIGKGRTPAKKVAISSS